jgi:ABC-2 type transport system permease protein
VLRKYAALIRTCWALSLEYRAEGFIWLMTNLLSVIMMAVWLSISRDGPVNGFAGSDFVAYFMVGLVVRQLTGAWSAWTLSSDIREGRLSSQLLRPIHPIHMEIANNWSEKAMRLTILLPIVALVFVAMPGARAALSFTPCSALAFAVSVVLAWAIYFLADYATGILAFWTSQALAFTQVLWSLKLMLSGIIAPLQMFPPAAQAVLQWLPFRYMLAFSNEIALGLLDGPQIALGLAVQLGWVAALWILVAVLWRRGLRAYSSVGA